jgi:hypothetical protein
MDTTTIAVKKETKELLNSFGSKSDTYDDVIRNMSVAYEEFMKWRTRYWCDWTKQRAIGSKTTLSNWPRILTQAGLTL